MRLALVTNTLPPEGRGGAEAYVAGLARELSARHDVVVLTGGRATLDGVETVHLPGLPSFRATLTPRGRRWHARPMDPGVHRATMRALERSGRTWSTHAVQGLSAAIFTAIGRRGSDTSTPRTISGSSARG